ncbi:protein CUSTOS-like [Saccostrea echinata]|uniref:protein CUSTOS-like n=1 Tax=Saccostrea echinata TaxID=191078 RepID=UPI002A83F012|nr:protein CUSTOS-like [Saccostrea echinata]
MEDESDSDSSTDEIENQRLKEAAIGVELIVRETKRKETRSQENVLLPSQRASSPVPENNPMNTTPEFRNFVAKKLSELLDRSLKDKGEEIKKIEINEEDTGIKLFSTSSTLIREVDEEVPTSSAKQRPANVKRRKLDSSSDSSDEESKLADAAVSVEQIMKESKSPYIRTHNKKEKTILIVKEETAAKKKKKKHKKKKDEIKVS